MAAKCVKENVTKKASEHTWQKECGRKYVKEHVKEIVTGKTLKRECGRENITEMSQKKMSKKS